MSQSTEFLHTFAAIENALRHRVHARQYLPFFELVHRAAQGSAVVRRFVTDLKEYADLRNAIVHERGNWQPIAEPHAKAVADLGRILSMLTNPPRVLPAFARKVSCVEADASMADVLPLVGSRKFSQVPVIQEGRLIALLTTNTLARWVAAHAGLVDITEPTVSALLKHAETEDNWRLVPSKMALADAVAEFDRVEATGYRLDAVLISANGRPTESLLGIITIHDMPKVFRQLEGRGRPTDDS